MNAPLETPLVAQRSTLSDAADGVSDGVVTAAIETLLATKKGLSSHLITGSAPEGLVQLTGFADNLPAGQRADASVTRDDWKYSSSGFSTETQCLADSKYFLL